MEDDQGNRQLVYVPQRELLARLLVLTCCHISHWCLLRLGGYTVENYSPCDRAKF